MEPVRIIASIYFENGHHGFEENYNEKQPVEDYVKQFVEQTRNDSDAQYPVPYYLEITTHDDRGDFIRDEFGDRVCKRIYLNEPFHENYMKKLRGH